MGNYQIAEHLLKSEVETLQNKQHPRAYLALENLVNKPELRLRRYIKALKL
jgi:hypothetical protein